MEIFITVHLSDLRFHYFTRGAEQSYSNRESHNFERPWGLTARA